MLVYLDTSHFAMLERLSGAGLTHFIKHWTARRCVLALSLNHAQEHTQLADETSRQRRLDMIGQFSQAPIRFSPRESAGLLDLELVTDIRALAGGGRIPRQVRLICGSVPGRTGYAARWKPELVGGMWRRHGCRGQEGGEQGR